MQKKYIIRISSLLILLLLIQEVGSAQSKELICPEPRINKASMQKFIDMRSKDIINKDNSSRQVRVYFHIVENDNGTSPGAGISDVLAEFNTLQTDYANANICFVYAGLNYIQSSELNHMNVETNDNAENLFNDHAIAQCLNVFYTKEILGKNGASGGTIGGIAFQIPGYVCLVAKDNLGAHSTSHEAGHCLGLQHTFSTYYGEEKIKRDASAYLLGDLFLDTDADPYSHRSETSCFSTNNGFYTGSCKDPAGKSNFDPPYTNVMSYWHHAPETFTTEQFNAMRTMIDNDLLLRTLVSSDNVTISNKAITSGTNYTSAINNLTTSGSVTYNSSGFLQAGLFAKKVVLNEGFKATVKAGDFVEIAADECILFSGKNLSTGSNNFSPDNFKNEEPVKPAFAFKVFPNPAISYFILQYAQEKIFDASIIVRTTDGKIIYSKNIHNVFQLNEKIDMSGKSKGIYFIEVFAGGKHFTGKLILQ